MAIDLESVRQRVEDLGLFTSVSDGVNAASAMETGIKTPAAFVVTGRERAEPNRTQGVHDQRVTQTVAVLMAIAAQSAAGDKVDRLEEAREAVTAQLAAWTPTGARGPFQYEGFSIVRMGQGMIWAELAFTTTWTLRI